jgi:hypothetical protein
MGREAVPVLWRRGSIKVSLIFVSCWTYLERWMNGKSEGERIDDEPFLAGKDLKEDFLASALAGAEVGYEIVLCCFAPGGGSENAAQFYMWPDRIQ